MLDVMFIKKIPNVNEGTHRSGAWEGGGMGEEDTA